MKNKRSPALLLFALSAAIGLSGCQALSAPAEQLVKASILKHTDFESSEEYVQAKAFQTAAEAGHANQVRILFAENNHLKLAYYLNESCTIPVDFENCYLSPGDSLYFREMQENSQFALESFLIAEFGEEAPVFSTQMNSNSKNVVLTIPTDYTGTELTLFPVGQYRPRDITFTVLPDSGSIPIGKWLVNDNQRNYSNGTYPVTDSFPYTVRFDYSSYCNNYYLIDSTPACYYSDDQNGLVDFSVSSLSEEPAEFKIQLHHYLKLNIHNEEFDGASGLLLNITSLVNHEAILKSLEINDKSYPVEDKKDFSPDAQLKVGASVKLRLADGYNLSVDGVNDLTRLKVGQAWEYAFTIPDLKDGVLSVSIRKAS